MKILIINTFYPPVQVGGAENSVRELAVDLVELGHSVVVVAMGRPRSHIEELNEGVRVYRMFSRAADPYFEDRRSPLKKLTWHLSESFRLRAYLLIRRVIRREHPDVVHINSPGGFGAAAWLASRGVPVVHTLRDFYLLCASFRTFSNGVNCARQCGSCRLTRLGVASASSSSDEVVSISEATAVRHQNFGQFADREVTVIPNSPVDYATGLRSTAGFTTFGFIGRVEEYKGIWIALRAFETLDDPSLRFVVAGGASSEDRVRLEQWSDTRVSYWGRTDPERFYSAVDVVVVPSQWHEPFGRVAAEAALAGCAVVVSGLGGLPEAAAKAVSTTVVHDAASLERWSEAMASLSAFRSRGATSVSDHETSVGRAYSEVYRRAREGHSTQ